MFCLPVVGLILMSKAITAMTAVTDYFGKEGDNVTLLCPFEKNGNNPVTWERNGEQYSSDIIINPNLSPVLRDRLTIVGSYDLHIQRISSSDEGQYNCITVLTSGSQGEHGADLYLTTPPTSVMIQNVNGGKVSGTEGQMLTLSCIAEGGKPPPSVVLTISNVGVAVTGNQSVEYTNNNVPRNFDRQTVTCQAHNSASTNNLTESATLYLKLKPLQPTFHNLPISTVEWATFTVSCTSNGSRPVAAFHWKIGQNVVTSQIQDTSTHDTTKDTYTVTSTLTHSVNRSLNSQNITCTAVNEAASNGVSNSVLIDVKYPPDVTVQNKTYSQDAEVRTVQCIANGNPNSYTFYKWQHKSKLGQFIQALDGGSAGVLTLHSNSVEERYRESGEYICTVSNVVPDREGRVNQTGSGWVTINAQPVFTNDNKMSLTQFGEFGKNGTIFVNVYSHPIFNTLTWFHGKTTISSNSIHDKTDYVDTVVTDIINGKQIQLDGYRVTLTIDKLKEDDFTNYTLQLSNGIGSPVQHVITLKSGGAPQIPINFTISGSSESSVTVQWIPGYNGGNEHTFYLEYRIKGSSVFLLKKIPNDEQLTGVMSYTLTGLQDGTWFEMRMYASNEFNNSSRTDIETIQTLMLSDSQTSLGPILGGVGGGLVVLIVIMLIVVFITKRQGDIMKCLTRKPSRKTLDQESEELKDTTQNESQTYGLKPNILYQSAGSYEKPLGTEYAEVVKNPQKTSMFKYEISDVKDPAECASPKSKGHIKNEKLTKKKKKILEDRAEYANADLPLKIQDDEEYVNSDTKSYATKNAEGLQYADIYFTKEQKKDKKMVIHGEEDRTVYSEIDPTKKAPPAQTESEFEETNLRKGFKI